MIKGDIDLTKNLDFRYDSSDKLPQKLYNTVPWKEADHPVTTINYTIYDSVSNSNISLFYNNSTYKIEIKLNAPFWKDPPYTITVIVSGAIDKEWNFPAERDDKVFKWFEELFER